MMDGSVGGCRVDGRVWWGGGNERECSGVDDATHQLHQEAPRLGVLDLFFSRGNGTKIFHREKDRLRPQWSKLTTPKYPRFGFDHFASLTLSGLPLVSLALSLCFCRAAAYVRTLLFILLDLILESCTTLFPSLQHDMITFCFFCICYPLIHLTFDLEILLPFRR